MSTLALLGGERIIKEPLKRYNSIGKEELEAAISVVESGLLSQYLGCWHEDFYGGPKVQEFERAAEKYFDVKHAVTVNSLTSGLITAVGALGVEPGDEVIVSPWTMTASATAILVWNAIPVFADIEDETFNLDSASIEKNISPYTKAIMSIDIFGHSADMDSIMGIAEKYDLKVISDCAQSPNAKYKGKFAGTLADIGGFSLNYHKHIHTGEGGIVVTNDDKLAERMQLIRNHAEAVVGETGITDLSNMIGFNFRLGEIEAAIGIEQLKKLDQFVSERIKKADRLTKGLKGLKGLRTPIVKKSCNHVYYGYPLLLDSDILGCSRDRIYKALKAEGVPVSNSYENLHLLPMYQNKMAYGKKGFPWNSEIYKGNVSYNKGICPVAEDLNDNRYMGIGLCSYEFTDDEIDLVIESFEKVWNNLDQL